MQHLQTLIKLKLTKPERRSCKAVVLKPQKTAYDKVKKAYFSRCALLRRDNGIS
jgi:hypothetical protein